MKIRWILMAALALPVSAGAVDFADGKFSINGFGGWATGYTNNKNEYVIANGTGTIQKAQAALVISVLPLDQLSINAQSFFTAGSNGNETQIDWAFCEWRFSDALQLRVGRVKMPFGLFGEIPDVGTLRPMLLLAQSVYGKNEMMSQAYNGIGLTGRVELPRDWNIEYDAFGGALSVYRQSSLDVLDPGAPAEPRQLELQVIGARASLLPPIDGLRFMISSYGGRIAPVGGVQERFVLTAGVSAEYVASRFSARGEYVFRTEQGDETSHAEYVEAAYFLTDQLQVVARAEASAVSVPWHTAYSSIKRHDEAGAGLNYWLSRLLVIKASYHYIYGNRMAIPRNPEEALASGTLRDVTHAVLLGAHFSY